MEHKCKKIDKNILAVRWPRKGRENGENKVNLCRPMRVTQIGWRSWRETNTNIIDLTDIKRNKISSAKIQKYQIWPTQRKRKKLYRIRARLKIGKKIKVSLSPLRYPWILFYAALIYFIHPPTWTILLLMGFALCSSYSFYTPINLGPFSTIFCQAKLYFVSTIYCQAKLYFVSTIFCQLGPMQPLFILYTHQLGPMIFPICTTLDTPQNMYSEANS